MVPGKISTMCVFKLKTPRRSSDPERAIRMPMGIRKRGARRADSGPDANEVMAELSIDISRQRAKSLSELDDTPFDYVVAMCADAAENCPIFPGGATYFHHPFDDPAAGAGSSPEQCAPFRYVRDRIGDWIEATFSHHPSASSNISRI